MDFEYVVFLLVSFLAVVLLLEGVYLVWRDWRGAEVRQLDRRLRRLTGQTRERAKGVLLKNDEDERAMRVDRLLRQLPRFDTLSDITRQAGLSIGATQFLVNVALAALAVGLLALIFKVGVLLAMMLSLATVLGAFAWLASTRRRRLEAIEKQLPDAVELIARSLRAGHALSPSLQMVAEELPEPIAREFRITAEEVTFGISLNEAMTQLARRVPLDDVRFFVIAVILQRETGGNLAEILDNIGHLIRERFKLLGKVRVLTAEGRLSAWILTLLPFGTAVMIQVVSPGFMSVLWTDPMGFKLVLCAGAAMAVGIVWMWNLVKIRV